MDYGDKLPPCQWYIFTPPLWRIIPPPLTPMGRTTSGPSVMGRLRSSAFFIGESRERISGSRSENALGECTTAAIQAAAKMPVLVYGLDRVSGALTVTVSVARLSLPSVVSAEAAN